MAAGASTALVAVVASRLAVVVQRVVHERGSPLRKQIGRKHECDQRSTARSTKHHRIPILGTPWVTTTLVGWDC